MMVPLSWLLIFSAVLFSIGLYGVLARKNAIAILMVSLLSATPSSAKSHVYDLMGHYLGTISEARHLEHMELRAQAPTIISSTNGMQEEIAAGLYIFSPERFADIGAQDVLDEFRFEDVTQEFLPQELWDAGGVQIADLNGDGYTNIEKYINGISTKKKTDWTDLKNNHDTLAEGKGSLIER